MPSLFRTSKPPLIALLVAVASLPQARAEAPAERPWSLTAGIDAPVFIGYCLNGLCGADDRRPLGFLLGFEHRLGSAVALTAALRASHFDAANSTQQDRMTSVGVSLGGRISVARTEAVDVSLFTAVSASYSDAMSRQVFADGEAQLSERAGWTVAASVGFSVDIRLVEQLWLRLATPLFELSGGESTTTSRGSYLPNKTDDPGSELSARFVVAPQIALKIDF